ncbi:MAG: bifunctional (p)ppGpp synthetase/guanosine-3',5'-bis(diphosphate) 3'-pyrophosphohydrolase [Ignavibacteriae bacterium]|nr:bifunctional (p)ppGpp synthetase/guanosine-3',5'-bis(diphosphate) 3'-pyrophosphohydrolase [Ignavibacteriota bacterium]
MKLWSLIKKSELPEKEFELGIDPVKDLGYLLQQCRNQYKSFDEALITKAFNWCYDTHKNKTRRSGKPFYVHPLSVALIVVKEMPLDDISVVCALLHNVVDEGNTYGIKDIQNEFGPTVAEIIEHIIKIKYIEGRQIEHLENYRKLLLALFKDVRIILIKLADRLDNLRSIEYLEEDKQKKMSEETLEVYSAFAHRFGLGSLKWELEDLAFKVLNKEAYDEISNSLQLKREDREEFIQNFTYPIKDKLSKDELLKRKNIKFDIIGRPKHIFSIYNKMKSRGLPITELFDLFAIRIILDTDDSSYCFIVYGIISDIFKPVPGTFKDYISNPKKNGYQSLHTAVIDTSGKPVEIQIRTKKMDEIAEKGVASHFNYKRDFLPAQSVLDDRNIEEWMGLVRNVFEYAGDETPEELIDSVRKNLFSDEIFVFTPTYEFRKFPKDASPLDFAFAIHSEIGFHCIGAKVNGKVVPLDYKLQSGDVIEILTSKNQKPKRDWLKFVVTQRSKNNIQKYLKDEKKRDEERGLSIWKGIVNRYNIKENDNFIHELLQELKFESMKNFFQSLGSANFDVSVVYEFLSDKKINLSLNHINGEELLPDKDIPQMKDAQDSITTKIKNASINVSYAGCCHPLPGDKIVGHIKEGHEIIVHQKSCGHVKHLIDTHQTSLFDMDWSNLIHKDFTVKIRVVAEEKPEILNEITTKILSLKKVNFRGLNINNIDEGLEGIITANLHSIEDMNTLFDSLRQLNGIKSVERYNE